MFKVFSNMYYHHGYNIMFAFTSILRETSIDGTGWSPARRLKVCVCVCLHEGICVCVVIILCNV